MLNIDQLMEEFVETVIKRGYELEEGDVKKANRLFDKIKSLVTKIKKLENYPEKMKELLHHENDHVKLKAAFELLPVYTEEAENVLYELSQKKGRMTTTSARITLERWRKGELHKDKN